MKLIHLLILLLIVGYNSKAQNSQAAETIDVLKNEAAKNIQSNYEVYKKISLNIWEYAEVGFKEDKSSLCYKIH